MRVRVLTGAVALILAAGAGTAEASTSSRVAALQAALRAHGLYRAAVDGIPGPLTSAAVRRFQRRAGLVPDGVAGPLTRKALGPLGRPRLGARLVRKGQRGWDVAALQFQLRRSGHPPGRVDGVFGPATLAALLGYQSAAGLAVDGLAGSATLRALAGNRGAAHATASASRVRVSPGDTLSGIAARHGTTVAALARANGLRADRVLLAGTVLSVPQRSLTARSELSHGQVRALIDAAAARHGVRAALVRALAWQESGFQTHLVSPAGAAGVMQVIPASWAFVEDVLLGRSVPRTPAGNVEVGTALLAHLVRTLGGERAAIAAYYQGAESVRRRGILPETATYVANVLALVGRV